MRHRCARALPLLLLAASCTPADEPNPAAVKARVETGMRKAFEWNLAALLSHDPAARREALARFGRAWGDMRGRVAALASSKRPAERIAAAWLVAKLGSYEDLPAMRVFLGDSDAKVRIAVMTGIARLADRSAVSALESLAAVAKYDELRAVLETLEVLDPGRAEAVALSTSTDTAWGRRRAAAQSLARLASSASAARLTALLDDAVWWIRVEAIHGCRMRAIRSVRERVGALTGDAEWPVRAAAARALGTFGEPVDLAIVARAAGADAEKGVRIAAARALAGFAPEDALPVLSGLVAKKGEHDKVKRAAIESVASFAGADARELLERLGRDADATVRRIAGEVAARRVPAAKPDKDEDE